MWAWYHGMREILTQDINSLHSVLPEAGPACHKPLQISKTEECSCLPFELSRTAHVKVESAIHHLLTLCLNLD